MIGMKTELQFSGLAGGNGICVSGEDAKVKTLSAVVDYGNPLPVRPVPMYANVTRCVRPVLGLIGHVLLSCRQSQVFKAIIRADVVNMINVVRGKFPIDIEPYQTVNTIRFPINLGIKVFCAIDPTNGLPSFLIGPSCSTCKDARLWIVVKQFFQSFLCQHNRKPLLGCDLLPRQNHEERCSNLLYHNHAILSRQSQYNTELISCQV